MCLNIILTTGDTAVNKAKVPALMEFMFCWEKTENKLHQ